MTTKSKERLAADTLIDEAQGFVEEVLAATNHTVPALLPLVGGWVRYQVRRGHSIPMLVTAVYSPQRDRRGGVQRPALRRWEQLRQPGPPAG